MHELVASGYVNPSFVYLGVTPAILQNRTCKQGNEITLLFPEAGSNGHCYYRPAPLKKGWRPTWTARASALSDTFGL